MKNNKIITSALILSIGLTTGSILNLYTRKKNNINTANALEQRLEIHNLNKEHEKELSVVKNDKVSAAETHTIKIPKGCNTAPIGKGVKTSEMKDLTYKALKDNSVKLSSGEGGADHELLENETGYKKKVAVLDSLKKEIGRNNINLFNPLDVRQISGLNKEQLEKVAPAELKEIVPVLLEAEKGDKPINAVFLLSICRLESADGTSELCKTKNNVAGINAQDADKGTSAYGDSYATKTDSAKALVAKIRDEYVYSDTDFRSNGPSIYDINKKYCSMTTWSYKVIDKAFAIEKETGLK